MIHKFKATVTITKEVVIQIDDTIFDKAAMQEFREAFYDADTYADHAESIAQFAANNDDVSHLEGYSAGAEWIVDFKNVEPSTACTYSEVSGDGGVRVQVVGSDCDVEVEEVKDEPEN